MAPTVRETEALTIERHKADKKRYSTHIDLFGESNTPYDAIIRVLDAARLAGDDDVRLVIR